MQRTPGLRSPLFDLIGSSIAAVLMISALFSPGIRHGGDAAVCIAAVIFFVVVAIASGVALRRRNRREGRA